MAKTEVSSELTPKEKGGGVKSQDVTHPVFKITNIPEVMSRLGWKVSAIFMRKWFNDAYYEMSSKEKLNKVDMATISTSHIVDDISFNEWLMKNDRVSEIINKRMKGLRNIIYYNGFMGKVKGSGLSVLSPGLLEILSRLDALGWIDHKNNLLKTGGMDCSDLPAMKLDKTTQFNFIRIGSTTWEKANDKMDDVYGALGSFIVKFALTSFAVEVDSLGFTILRINELGLYVRDTYEFMNDGDDQILGYWGWGGVLKPGLFNYYLNPDKIKSDGEYFYRVTNNSFVQYRNKMKDKDKTGDFFVYSTVRKEAVDIMIPIDKTDIMEYRDKKGIAKK